jgi:hypothetical protein
MNNSKLIGIGVVTAVVILGVVLYKQAQTYQQNTPAGLLQSPALTGGISALATGVGSGIGGAISGLGQSIGNLFAGQTTGQDTSNIDSTFA